MTLDLVNTLTLDHFIPLGRGGFNVWGNYRAACHPCNNLKGNMLPEEFYAALLGEG